MSQIIVLGWDALDIELIEEYGLQSSFGTHQREIETYVNPVIDHPHTRELWPSMITGLHPDEHGVHAVSDDDGVDWDNPVIDTASNLANGVVPQPVLDYIGERLRERGAGLDQKRVGYYEELPTVFAESDQAISVPNYRTQFDQTNGLDATRDNVWEEILVNRDGKDGFNPAVSTDQVYNVLGREIGERVGATLSAIQQSHGLVWTWFGCLDTVGHMAPAMDCSLEEDWYRVAANVTEAIRACAPDDAIVVSVSDHGLQEGEHTDYATLCSDSQDAVDSIESIFDIKPWLDAQDPSAQRSASAVSDDGMGEVRTQLEELGYI